MKQPKYPLQQINTIKRNRLNKAEQVLKNKRLEYQQAKEKLENIQKSLEEILNKKKNIWKKHLTNIESSGTTSKELEIHEKYLQNVIDEEIKKKQEEVDLQKGNVENAKIALEKARKDRLEKHLANEKMLIQKEIWTKQIQEQNAKAESHFTSEIGTTIFTRGKNGKR